jgi:hypothetical protein
MAAWMPLRLTEGYTGAMCLLKTNLQYENCAQRVENWSDVFLLAALIFSWSTPNNPAI